MYAPARKTETNRTGPSRRGVRRGLSGLGCGCQSRGLGNAVYGSNQIIDPLISPYPPEWTLSVAPVVVTHEVIDPNYNPETGGSRTSMRTEQGVRVSMTQNPGVFIDYPASFWPPASYATAQGRRTKAIQMFEAKRVELATRGAGDNYDALTPPDLNQPQYRNDAVAYQAFLDRVPVYVQGPLVDPSPEVLARADRAAGNLPVPVNFTDAAARDAVAAAGLRPRLRLLNEAAIRTEGAIVNANVPEGAEGYARAAYAAVTAPRPAAVSDSTPSSASASSAASAPASVPSATSDSGAGFGSSFVSAFTPARSSATPATLSPASSSSAAAVKRGTPSTSAASGRGGLILLGLLGLAAVALG